MANYDLPVKRWVRVDTLAEQQAQIDALSARIGSVDDQIATLFHISSYSQNYSANVEANINITQESGYSKGVYIGCTGSNNNNVITLVNITVFRTDYPYSVRFKTTEAQTITAYILWMK